MSSFFFIAILSLLTNCILFTPAFSEQAKGCYESFEVGKKQLELGKYDNSIVTLQKVIEQCAQDKIIKGKSYKYIGNAYFLLRDYSAAKKYYKLAEPLVREMNEPLELAKVYRNLGNMAFEDEKENEAVQFYQKALEIEKKEGRTDDMAKNLINLGNVFLYKYRRSDSVDFLKTAKGYYFQAFNLGLQDQARLYLGLCDFFLDRYAESMNNIDEARALFEKKGDLLNSGRAYYYSGLVLKKRGKTDDALLSFKKAAEHFENMRTNLMSERSRAYLWDDKAGIYEHILELLVTEKKDYREAWAYAERIKARSFLDMIGTREINAGYTGTDKHIEELIKKDRELLKQLVENLSENEESHRPDSRDTISNYENNLKELTKAVPEYVSLISASIIEFENLISILKEDDASLVEYYIGIEHYYIWVINPDGSVHCTKGAIPSRELNKIIISAYQKKDPGLKADNVQEFQEVTHELYSLLFQPARDRIGRKKVYIVPHGLLHHYPLQALITEMDILEEDAIVAAPKYLIEDGYLFSYLPSATMLRFVKQKDTAVITPLIIGNPVYAEPGLKSLEKAEKEANEIGEILGTKPVLREEATETLVKKSAGKYNFILFATHGSLDSKKPMQSKLFFTKDAENDGSLTVEEIFNLKMDSDLIVLSACQTGMVAGIADTGHGDFSGGDDLVGISMAFLYAGTRNIMSTLWTVSDATNYELNLSLHRNLFIKKERKAEALRNAELAMIKRAKEDHSIEIYPHYWAPFLLTGRF